MTTAARDVIAGPVSAIPPDEGRTFVLGGLRIAIFHTRTGQVFATQADCPHKNGPLADGLVGNGLLICPLHSWKFELATGKALYGECGLTTYPAKLDEQQRVVVTVPALD
jgi:nitrite reductase (NADH) small subunit